MGQFKPMVKMYTTEPTVELKLKKGGSATYKKLAKMKAGGHGTGHKMMDGGPTVGMRAAPMIAAEEPRAVVAVPRKPSMAERARAIRGRRPMVAALMKDGGESKAEHKAEMKTAKELKKHESMPASKAHKGLKTGGVVMGQGGFKKGGKVKKYVEGGPTEGEVNVTSVGKPTTTGRPTPMPEQSNKAGAVRGLERAAAMSGRTMPTTGRPDTVGRPIGVKTGGVIKSTKGKTKMHTAKHDTKGGSTGGVKLGNSGGFKKGGHCYAKGGGVEGNVSSTPAGRTNTSTGDVSLGKPGGYKKGGHSKKAVDGGMKGAPAVKSRARKYMDGGAVGLPTANPVTGRVGLPNAASSGRIYDPSQALLTQTPGYGPRPMGYAKGGGVNDEGKPEKMPQGRKPPTPMVRLTQLSGTFKSGGKVKK